MRILLENRERKVCFSVGVWVVVILIAALGPARAGATTWYVAPASMGGNDANSGSISSPWRTIQYAVDQATTGDTIKVMDDDNESTDDYTENVTVNKGVTIERYNSMGANPQVAASSKASACFYVTASHVTIKGLDIYGSSGMLGLAGICLYSVADCNIEDNRCGWNLAHRNREGIKLISSNSVTISGNTCVYNEEYGINIYSANDITITDNNSSSNYGSGIGVLSSNNNIIAENDCRSNNDAGIYVYSSFKNKIFGNDCNSNDGSGINIASSNNITSWDNVCTFNKNDGISLLSSNNNRLWDNECRSNWMSGIFLYQVTLSTISGNVCNKNGAGWSIGGRQGISVISSEMNTIAGNECNSNKLDGMILSYSNKNTIWRNVCKWNGDPLGGYTSPNIGYSISVVQSSNNRFCLNSLSSNSHGNAYVYGGSGNIWNSSTKLSYRYSGSAQTYKSYIGNYYGDYTGSDANGDGIGESTYTGDGMTDGYPLKGPAANYDLWLWRIAMADLESPVPIMYRGPLSEAGASLTLDGGFSQIWAAEEAADVNITFGEGESGQATSWTGQLSFASAPNDGNLFTINIGYADDANGANFWENSGGLGLEANVVGDGSETTFTYATNAVGFTVPQGKHIALNITNDSNSSYDVRVGGLWSYCSAPVSVNPSAPPHDECSDAIEVVEGGIYELSSVGAKGTEVGGCDVNAPNDVWHLYSPVYSGDYIIRLCDSMFDTTLTIYDGCGGVELACNDNSCGVQSEVTVSMSAGHEYLLRVAGDEYATGDYTLTVTPPRPPHDACPNAIEVAAGQIYSGSTVGADGTDISSCGPNDTMDVWHWYTAVRSGSHILSLCRSDFDTTLAVFDSCGGTELACNDDACDLQSEVVMSMTEGETYFIRVSGADGEAGRYKLEVIAPPAHDECGSAMDLTYAIPNSNSTALAGGTDVTSCGLNDTNDVWHSFSPGVDANYMVSLCGSDFDTTLAVFDSCGGTELVCNDDYCDSESELTVKLVAGNGYLIRVAGYYGEVGNYTVFVTLAGDLDADGNVDLVDYALFAGKWLESNCIDCSRIDIDHDWDVDYYDLRE
ncbi:MAG: right-handed parallel beta-helix repeat-containing protein [Planctomycetota bacterium]|jgi:parallel beta-helix repeat protein